MRGLPLSNLSRTLGVAGSAAAIALLALAFALVARNQPAVALAVPAVFGTALVSSRWPAAAVALTLLLSGIYGSIQAFGGPSVGPAVDVLILGMWTSVVVSRVVSSREYPSWVSPGLAMLIVYLAITFLEIGTASSVGIGIKSFRYSALYMTAVPLLALAGWRLRTYLEISKWIVYVTLLVAGYAVLRLIIGPASREAAYAIQSAGPFTTVGGTLSLIGSFPSRHALAFWVACAAPFCFSVALTDPRQRKTAAIAVGLCLAAAYGTDVRTALAAVIAGGAIVILLHQVSAGGRAVGRTVAAIAIAAVGGAVLFSAVAGSNSGRYGAILSPGGDLSWQHHITKWRQALSDISGNPFGKGLGTGGRLAQQGETGIVTIATYNLDSSYLKIAYEQGIPILAFFVASLLALLVGIGRRVARARSPGVRALAIGAAGALVAALVMFFTGIYVEDLIALAVWLPVGAAIGAIGAEQAERNREHSQIETRQLAAREPLPAGQSA